MIRFPRSFAVTGAAALMALAILFYVFYRHTAVEDLLHAEELQNIVLAQSLGNAIWLHHAEHIEGTSRADSGRQEAERDEVTHLNEEVERLSTGLPVLKIIIFNADGTIIYSSDPDETDADHDHHLELFEAARDGTASSHTIYRNDPFLLSRGLSDVDVVETFLPLRGADGKVRRVLELSSDVTERLGGINRMSALLLAGLLAGFAMLYGGFLPAVRRVERIVKRQHVHIRKSRQRLIEKNRELTAEIGWRVQVEADLREAHGEAKASSHAKSLFLANMSHELRTPLNAVIGFSQTMVDEVFGPVSPSRYRQYTQDIRDSGQHLLALVNNILDLTKVETDVRDSDMSPFDIHGVIQDAARSVTAELVKNRNTLRVDCPQDLGTMVSEEVKVRGVLVNLISNAAKFTRNGLVKIEARRDGDGRVVIGVSDTGIGMDEGRIEAMFDEFTQHDNSFTRRFGGSGLGLAICRRYCEALGGGIAMESILGEGTTVTVRLPDHAAARANGATSG